MANPTRKQVEKLRQLREAIMAGLAEAASAGYSKPYDKALFIEGKVRQAGFDFVRRLPR